MDFQLQVPKEDLVFYGKSDLIAQITDELRNNPESCFSLNVISWYNSAYAQPSDFSSCIYQVDVDKQKCIDLYADSLESNPTIGSSLDFIVDTASALGRVDGRRLINNFCRLARRTLIERLAPRV
jgi:hypothetical protein